MEFCVKNNSSFKFMPNEFALGESFVPVVSRPVKNTMNVPEFFYLSVHNNTLMLLLITTANYY